jgi:hypothetical protein
LCFSKFCSGHVVPAHFTSVGSDNLSSSLTTQPAVVASVAAKRTLLAFVSRPRASPEEGAAILAGIGINVFENASK